MAIEADANSILAGMTSLGLPPIGAVSAAEMRALRAAKAPRPAPGPDMAEVVDLAIPAPHGSIPARLYRPQGHAARLIVFFHGGGWTFGGIAPSDAPARRLAEGTASCVLSIDYRLAPEHPFPAAVDDAFTATLWAFESRERLAGESATVLVAGESAGANLSAVVAQAARGSAVDLAAQILLCPCVTAEIETPFTTTFESPFLNLNEIRWFFDQYVPAQKDRSDPRFAPGSAADLAGLPATFIATAEYDLMREQGEAYADRLQNAGVALTAQRYTGAFHGIFELAGTTRQGLNLLEDLGAFVSGLTAPGS